MKTKLCYLLALLMLVLPLSACAKTSPTTASDNEIPEEIEAFIIEYLEATRNGFSAAENYIYFANDSLRALTLESPQKTMDYEIKEAEQINENLYAFTLLICAYPEQDYYRQIYNFVGRIDGQLYIIANVDSIPDNLKTGLNAEKYTYSDAT